MRRSNISPEVPSRSFKDSYLLFYNFLQIAGWTLVAGQSFVHLMLRGGSYTDLHGAVHCSLTTFQSLALLEIIHAALGLVRSNPLITAFQIFSRVFLLWGVTNLVDEFGFLMLLFAWTLTEIVRYSFYFCSILDNVPYWLAYARYTLFIALYPIGVTGELLTIYRALSTVKSKEILSYPLPNSLNISFSYFSFLVFVMLTYIPVFPPLYTHMFSQRKKVLNPRVGSEKKIN